MEEGKKKKAKAENKTPNLAREIKRKKISKKHNRTQDPGDRSK